MKTSQLQHAVPRLSGVEANNNQTGTKCDEADADRSSKHHHGMAPNSGDPATGKVMS